VEYFGEHVPGGCHRNSKNPSAPPYISMPAATMEEIADKLQHDGASQVYSDVRDKDDIADAPRNVRVVENKKASQARSARHVTGTRACHNLADEMQSVIHGEFRTSSCCNCGQGSQCNSVHRSSN